MRLPPRTRSCWCGPVEQPDSNIRATALRRLGWNTAGLPPLPGEAQARQWPHLGMTLPQVWVGWFCALLSEDPLVVPPPDAAGARDHTLAQAIVDVGLAERLRWRGPAQYFAPGQPARATARYLTAVRDWVMRWFAGSGEFDGAGSRNKQPLLLQRLGLLVGLAPVSTAMRARLDILEVEPARFQAVLDGLMRRAPLTMEQIRQDYGFDLDDDPELDDGLEHGQEARRYLNAVRQLGWAVPAGWRRGQALFEGRGAAGQRADDRAAGQLCEQTVARSG